MARDNFGAGRHHKRLRIFQPDRPANASRVAVINQSMAKFYFGNRSPIGQTLFYDNRLKFALTIVGVSKDVRDHVVREEAPRRFYVSYMQAVDGQMGADYEIRTPLDLAVMDHEIRAAVHAISPRMYILHIHRLAEQISLTFARSSFSLPSHIPATETLAHNATTTEATTPASM